MRLLSVFTNFLIRKFKVTDRELSNRHLILVVSLLISSIGLFGFALKSYSTNSLNLFYILFVSTVLNIINLGVLKRKQCWNFSSYFFIATILLTMSYFVFDSGRNGYGYIWFYTIPVLNISILGVKKGTISSFLFLLFLGVLFLLPSHIISLEYYKELKPRLLLSFFALILLILFREWTIEMFRIQRKNKEDIIDTNLEYKRDAIIKLSDQIRYVTNDILTSVNGFRKQNLNPQLGVNIDAIQASSDNLINILNSLDEFSELSFKSDNEIENYNLNHELESTCNLFSSYKFEINISIEDRIPPMLYGDPMLVRQIIYNVIGNFISDDLDAVEIQISKGDESEEFFEIRYQVIKLIKNKQVLGLHKQDCKKNELFVGGSHIKALKEIGLTSIIPLVQALDGQVGLINTKNFVSICFSQKLFKNKAFKLKLKEHRRLQNHLLQNDFSNELHNKKLNKMRVLLMEDNPIAQKSIVFALDKLVKNIDIAENGKQGLALVFKYKYDIILLDMNMPLLDGYEVTKKIRNIEVGTKIHIPIIAIISNYLIKDLDKIFDSGVDEYIVKPLKANDLVKKVNLLSLK